MATTQVSDNGSEHTISHQVGFYTAIFTVFMTVVTFGFAITAIPISGANCGDLCIEYPYLSTLSQFPKDYLWMPLAIILTLSYLVLMVSIHIYASNQRKVFSQIGLSFALLATMFLVGDYFVQFSVVPISLMSGETEGITLLTQYNAHGVLIVMEELGYLLMSLSFLFMAPVFVNKNRLEVAVRWVFVISFLLTMFALTLISINYGLDRQDRFEVAVISINWLVLIINSVLLSIVLRRQLIKKQMTGG